MSRKPKTAGMIPCAAERTRASGVDRLPLKVTNRCTRQAGDICPPALNSWGSSSERRRCSSRLARRPSGRCGFDMQQIHPRNGGSDPARRWASVGSRSGSRRRSIAHSDRSRCALGVGERAEGRRARLEVPGDDARRGGHVAKATDEPQPVHLLGVPALGWLSARRPWAVGACRAAAPTRRIGGRVRGALHSRSRVKASGGQRRRRIGTSRATGTGHLEGRATRSSTERSHGSRGPDRRASGQRRGRLLRQSPGAVAPTAAAPEAPSPLWLASAAAPTGRR